MPRKAKKIAPTAPTPSVPLENAHAYGTVVRWLAGGDMRAWAGDTTGTVVPQPIGSVGRPPPGGTYVLWSKLREPMACFIDDLEVVE